MNRFRTLLLPVAIATLTACGGGGGGAAVTPGAQASLTGVVSKGFMVNADVIVEEIKADGTVARQLATGTTNGSGQYTIPALDAAYAGGPIRVRAVPNSTTTMICDVTPSCAGTPAIAFGGSIPLPATFSMSALIPSVPVGSTTVSVTALTDMAATRAIQRATTGSTVALTNARINEANSEVSQIVGVNIIATSPADVAAPGSASPESKTYAAFLAGIGELANSSATGTTFGEKLQGTLTSLATSFQDGQLTASDSITAPALVAAVNSQNNGNGFSLDNPLLTLATEQITAQTTGGTYNPEPSSTANATAIVQAKALIANARTFLFGLESLGDEPDADLVAYEEDIHAVEVATDERSVALFNRVAEVMDGLNAAIDADPDFGVGDSVTFQNYTLSVPNTTGVVSATITDGNTADGVTFTGVTMSSGLTAAQITALENDSWTNLGSPTWTLAGTVASAGARLALSNVRLAVGPITRQRAADSCNEVQYAAGECDVKMFNALDLGGTATYTDLVNNGTFSGTFGLTSVQLATSARRTQFSSTSPQLLQLSGTFNGGNLGGSAEAQISVRVNNAASFDTFGAGMIETQYNADTLGVVAYLNGHPAIGISGSEVISAFYYNDMMFGEDTCFESETDFNCVSGDVLGVKNRLRADAIAYGYPSTFTTGDLEYVDFEFVRDGTSFLSYFNGELPSEFVQTATYFANITVSGRFTSTIPEFGATGVVFTFNRTKQDAGNTSIAITRGTETFTILANNDAEANKASVTVRNAQGLSLSAKGSVNSEGGLDSFDGNLTLGSTVLGTILQGGIIRYTNGTFESLM